MVKRDTISLLEEILNILNKNKELSKYQLQKKLKVGWNTLKRCLDFLVKIKIVKSEKTGNKFNDKILISLNKIIVKN